MTDEELMKRLRHRGTYNEVFDNAVWDSTADRIEQLTAELNEVRKEWEGWQSTAVKLMEKLTAMTAERDEAWAYMSALQGDLYDAIMIEAERDRLREAIMFWLEAQEPDVDAAIALMRAALKEEPK